MRNWVQIMDGEVVGTARLIDSAEPVNMTEVENITGSLMGATYDEENGTFTDSDGSIVAHAK
jgi:hypothetical protein